MRILVVGSGGREHALCWAIAASPLCDALFCAPGNAGIAAEATCIAIAAMDIAGIVAFCTAEKIDFVVVGPEQPLVAGIVDRLEEAGIAAFGPTAAAAALEGSKGFTKDFCARHEIPTAAYRRFADAAAAKDYVATQRLPIVVKADGLAAGKGVTIARSLAEANAAIDEAMVGQRFGAAGAELVIEEFLDGEEASFFALVDGKFALPLASAQDHKQVGDGDAGANTGGMGAYSPAPCVTPAIAETVMARIIRPTIAGMAAEGRPFKGILYAGLMLTKQGQKLIEYNTRFGDPECQVLMLRLRSDILPALIASRDGVLKNLDLRWSDDTALCVVLAARGYPGEPERGGEIKGLDAAAAGDPSVQIFHAATREENGRILADGGRVLGVAAIGKDVATAQRKAYETVDRIDWQDGFCRRDIGWRAIARGARE